ncbi:MAG: RNA helicase [Candidatus Solibacter sp.]|nr:RNA helicase [Candidatus Solibacter sp.]
MNHFSELPLCARLADNLAKNKFTQPTPVQSGAMPAALAGRDVVATAQTGTGKTLAFVVPMIERLLAQGATNGVSAVVLSPTRELAMQTSETFRIMAEGTGLRASVVVGGLSENPQLQAIRRGAQVLIATPGRLCDFLDRKLVKLDGVKVLVLDEGDRMLDMGFQPDIERIASALPAERQTMFFSATIEAEASRLISKYLRDPERIEVGSTTSAVDTVELHHYEMEQHEKLSVLELLLSRGRGAFLVFARTRSRADKLARQLTDGGVKAVRIHGDRTQAQRSQALKMFQQGHCRVMVATDVAARGIHVDGIEHVVNFDLPMAPEDFIHRVGRTGRAGASGVASTFSTRAERSEIRRIERTLKTRLTPKHTGRIPKLDAGEPQAAAQAAQTAEPRAETRPALGIDGPKPFTPNPKSDRRPGHRPARSDRAPRRELDRQAPAGGPKWEFMTGPQAFREKPEPETDQPEFRPKGPKTAFSPRPRAAFAPRPQAAFAPRRDEGQRSRDSKPFAKAGFKPDRESGPRRGFEPKGEFKPRWESKPTPEPRPRRDSSPAGASKPRFDAKPKWQAKPGRDERPAQRSDSPTVGSYTPKWAAKQEGRQSMDARPAQRSAERQQESRPVRKTRQDPPWANGPGAGPAKGPQARIWKTKPEASAAKTAPKPAGRKKVILKPAPRRSQGEAVFPWQGSGMTKLKRRA